MLSRCTRAQRFLFKRNCSSKRKSDKVESVNQSYLSNPVELIPSAEAKSSESYVEKTVGVKCSGRQTKIDFKHLKHASKIPEEPVAYCFANKSYKECLGPKIDMKTLQLLERLSLVNLDSKDAFENLEDSIEFAEKVLEISTCGVDPMHTVLEKHPLKTRVDEVIDGNIKEDVLSNASVTEEDYFVAPPGNIPVEQKEKKFD